MKRIVLVLVIALLLMSLGTSVFAGSQWKQVGGYELYVLCNGGGTTHTVTKTYSYGSPIVPSDCLAAIQTDILGKTYYRTKAGTVNGTGTVWTANYNPIYLEICDVASTQAFGGIVTALK